MQWLCYALIFIIVAIYTILADYYLLSTIRFIHFLLRIQPNQPWRLDQKYTTMDTNLNKSRPSNGNYSCSTGGSSVSFLSNH